MNPDEYSKFKVSAKKAMAIKLENMFEHGLPTSEWINIVKETEDYEKMLVAAGFIAIFSLLAIK